jgi:hypothetical protein
MEMSQIISKYFKTVKRILIEDEIPATFNNLKYYFNEEDVLIEIKNTIGIPNTIRLIYVLVLSDRGFNSEKIKDIIDRLQVYHIKQYVDEESRTLTCDSCDGSCRNCDGSGTEIETEEDDDGDEIEVEVKCSSCDGIGKESCNYCGGDGQFECDECGGSGEYESYEKYFQPDDYYFVKPYSSKDDDYLNKPYEIEVLIDHFLSNDLSMFLKKNYNGIDDEDSDDVRRNYNTDLDDFEIFINFFDLNYVKKTLF